MLNVLVIGGRTQREGVSNGTMECEEILLEALDKGGYSPLQARVRFLPWYADWPDVARRLHIERQRYKLERHQFGIVVCAFSRGVGYGVRTLGKELPRFGLRIDTLVACDGIYHRWWALWRSLWLGYRVEVPECVNQVYSFYQDQSVPKGLKPYVIPPTQILGVEKLDYEHAEMDDSAEWHAKCVQLTMNAARKYIPPARKTEVPNAALAERPLMKMESKLENTSAPTPEPLRERDPD